MARVTIRRGPPAVAMTAAWLIAAAVFGAQLAASDTTTGHAISLALSLLALAGAYRAYRSNTIVATDEGLVVRRFARTFRWPWSEVREIGAAERINGFRGKGKLIEIRTDQRDLRLLDVLLKRRPTSLHMSCT